MVVTVNGPVLGYYSYPLLMPFETRQKKKKKNENPPLCPATSTG